MWKISKINAHVIIEEIFAQKRECKLDIKVIEYVLMLYLMCYPMSKNRWSIVHCCVWKQPIKSIINNSKQYKLPGVFESFSPSLLCAEPNGELGIVGERTVGDFGVTEPIDIYRNSNKLYT